MSLENEDDSSAIEASESINESEKKPRISYARDFLLSLSELEICKRLPSGFDQSILKDFEENSIQERSRTHGSLPLQGFRRNDYSSSPPTRGDSSNYSRGVYGRWDNRSSGWSDKDGDSQSDMDPDCGRRNQSRRPWQNSEHDGLLGSGSFPRPSGFSASKGPSSEHHHLNRSNEAYQPPRPFKAGPAARTNTHDSFNDETFGSIESTSQDRAEEERKRRASFELMRKEQQKVLQEKQKTGAIKSDAFTDLILEESKEERVSEGSGELNSIVQSVPKDDDSGKSSTLLQSSKSRPLVPPGFKTTIVDKSSSTKPIFSTDKENPKPGIEEIHLLPKGNHTQNGTLDNQRNIQSGSSIVSAEKLGITDQHLHRIPVFPEAVDGEVFELMTNKVTGNKIPNNSSEESTSSILGNFFTKDAGSTSFLEKSKPDDPLSPHNVQSSRFAQWFNEDEKKPVDDFSSTRPNDLLSLIGGGEKAGPQAPTMTSTDPELSYTGFGITKTSSDSKHLFNNFRQESAPPVAAVLTCEDLEQTILSEYSEKSSNLQPHVPDWSISIQETVGARAAVDDHATNHLLSLLQKGTTIDETRNTNTDDHSAFEKLKDANQEANSGQKLSIESLFGTAFMKELQSSQAPVSAQRGAPPGSARIDIFEPLELSVSNIDGIGPTMTNYETSKQKQPVKSDDPESWLNFGGPRVDEFQRGVPQPGKQAGDIQLPEEESLIIVGDPANTHNQNVGKMFPPADVATFDIAEKLAALNSGFRGEQSVREMLEHERQFNNHNRRPMFHPSLDPNPQHMNSQMRFPEHLMQRENTLNQQFPPRLFHHHPDAAAAAAARVTGFDVPVHPQMLPQMRMQGNFPPPHLIHHDHVQRPPASNFMPDHGFPFAHRHPNVGGLGLPLPVPDSSGNPEAFQRMMEMERRAQSKAVNAQGMYRGHELDMDAGLGFRYR